MQIYKKFTDQALSLVQESLYRLARITFTVSAFSGRICGNQAGLFHGDTMRVCLRRNTKVYLILRVMIFELQGMDITRPYFAEGGFNRLTFGD